MYVIIRFITSSRPSRSVNFFPSEFLFETWHFTEPSIWCPPSPHILSQLDWPVQISFQPLCSSRRMTFTSTSHIFTEGSAQDVSLAFFSHINPTCFVQHQLSYRTWLTEKRFKVPVINHQADTFSPQKFASKMTHKLRKSGLRKDVIWTL